MDCRARQAVVMRLRRVRAGIAWLQRGNRGDTLIEVLAAVVLLGITVIPVSLFATNAQRWVSSDANREQALVYATAGAQYVREQELAAYSNNQFPTSVSPQTLLAVRGVKFTESINGPTPAVWNGSKLGLSQWNVTVSWTQPSSNIQSSVSLTLVVDPSVAE